MTVEKAKCPDCGTYLRGEEFEEIVVDSGSGGIAPMGAGKSEDETMYVCPTCDVILG